MHHGEPLMFPKNDYKTMVSRYTTTLVTVSYTLAMTIVVFSCVQLDE